MAFHCRPASGVQLLATLRNFSERLQNLLVAGSRSVIHFDKLPADHSLFIDDVSRRVGPAFAVGIQNAVAVDYFVVFVLEERKVVLSGKFLLQLFDKLLRKIVAVDTHRENLDLFFFLFIEQTFQLAELLRAVGSPVAAVKDQHNILLAAKVGKGNSSPVEIFQSEVRCGLSDLDSVKIRRREIRPILGTQLPKGRDVTEEKRRHQYQQYSWKHVSSLLFIH